MPQSPNPRLTGLDHLVLTVVDPVTTLRFYEEVLGMTGQSFEAADGSTRWAMIFGTQKINLHRAGAEFSPHAAAPGPGTADLCFLTETPLDVWARHLEANGVRIEAGPVPRTGATGPLRSLYIRDPDGNLVEIALPG